MDASQNLLASSLKAVEPQRQVLLTQRKYHAVEDLRNRVFANVAQMKSERMVSLRQVHQEEYQKLVRASEHALRALDAECDSVTSAQMQAWVEKKERLLRKHAQDLTFAEARIREVESHRRMIHSPYVRDLQQAEKRLAELHCYDECARTHRKIQKLELLERRKLEADRVRRIQTAMDRVRVRQQEEINSLQRRMQNALSIARDRTSAQRELNAYRFHILNVQMQHAHAVEEKEKVNLDAYQHPKWIAVPPRDRHAASKRGSQVMQSMRQDGLASCNGMHRNVPSLCERYGGVKNPGVLEATVSKERQRTASRASCMYHM